jgi:hypothetical protein
LQHMVSITYLHAADAASITLGLGHALVTALAAVEAAPLSGGAAAAVDDTTAAVRRLKTRI